MREAYSVDEIYRACMTCLLSCLDVIRIAVIGANDGKLGDPSFGFAERYKDRTSVLLIEPQSSLIPQLAKNYAFHPRHRIHNGAIGLTDSLTLYSIRPEYWDRVQPSYASNWPSYRAPTGITSTLRSHVELWIRNVSNLNPDDLIESYEVPCQSLTSLLKDLNETPEIDVLQIDTEGTDDLVLSACNLEATKPRIIIMETNHLGAIKEAELNTIMSRSGYISMLGTMNSLFIRQ
jgi:FkbM family methyltransferase